MSGIRTDSCRLVRQQSLQQPPKHILHELLSLVILNAFPAGHAITQYLLHHSPATGAERDTQADFVGPLRDGERHDPVDAERRQQQGDEREGAEQDGRESGT